MKERPILFSPPMVRAILEDRKTQTRRAVRKQFAPDAEPAEVPATSPEGWQISGHSGLWWDDAGACFDDAIRCPYGQPGDRLWVRETWQGPLVDDFESYLADPDKFKKPEFCEYAADGGPAPEFVTLDDELEQRWRPSIHMPRWASRILLEVVSLRVERLADISKDDAMAEGIVLQPDGGFGLADSTHYNFSDPTDSYCSLWESINGDGSWLLNPWVWVVEFKRLKGGA